MILYYPNGKRIPDEKFKKPAPGRSVIIDDSERDGFDVSRGLTPMAIDGIMTAANAGDTERQSRLSLEIREKNWDVAPALLTRVNAVLGIPWKVSPGGKNAIDKKAAEGFEAALKNCGSNNFSEPMDSYKQTVKHLMSSLLPGFAVSEIIWKSDGSLAGFSRLKQHHFTFEHSPVNAPMPRLVTRQNWNGEELLSGKYLVNITAPDDPARGGLIRPLAWLHCFANLNIKDLLRFIERYGMPFAVAKVDQETWDNEREAVKALIRSFGPDGGGVFTRATEIELLQAANNTGDVYFRLLEYLRDATFRVILGQTATSGDGGGLSKDNAQDKVRQDYLEADCESIEDTFNTQLAPVWTEINYPGAAVPQLELHCEPPEDLESFSVVVKTLHEAGFDADEQEMSERFGLKLTRRVETQSQPLVSAPKPTVQQPEKLEALEASPHATAKPGALQTPSVVRTAPGGSPVAFNASNEFIASGAVRRWLEPLQKQIDAACNEPDEAAAAQAILDLAADPEAFFAALDGSGLRESIENTAYAAYASGMAKAAEEHN